jgi:hypothetical protein
METNRKRRTSHSIRLEGTSHIIALTAVLVGPLVDTFAIKFHYKDVVSASVAVTINRACCGTSHPGMAIHIHLRKLVSWDMWCPQMRMKN